MWKLAFALILLPGLAQAGQKAKFLVCPPHLSYCYYETKPIRQQKSVDDELADILAEHEAAKAAIDQRARESDRALGRALSGARLCNSVRC